MTKVRDLGLNPLWQAADQGTSCDPNDPTCLDDTKQKPKKYQAFSPALVAQLKQHLDHHLGR